MKSHKTQSNDKHLFCFLEGKSFYFMSSWDSTISKDDRFLFNGKDGSPLNTNLDVYDLFLIKLEKRLKTNENLLWKTITNRELFLEPLNLKFMIQKHSGLFNALNDI